MELTTLLGLPTMGVAVAVRFSGTLVTPNTDVESEVNPLPELRIEVIEPVPPRMEEDEGYIHQHCS